MNFINLKIHLPMSGQKTLDQFFNIKNNESKQLKRYFYLNWEMDNHVLLHYPSMHYEKPSKINFIHKIKCDTIKKGFYFYICGYFENYNEDEYRLIKEKKYKNVYFLKSHLQKTIRVMDENKAIPSALHLMQLDMDAFLRRLIIIHLEDTFLHENLSIIIWLMIALTKKFKMKKYIYEWILGFVYITTKTKKKDNMNKIIKGLIQYDNKSIYQELMSYEKITLDKKQETLLYALNLITCYGGKPHDIEMIKKFICLWKTRFHTNSNLKMNKMHIQPIDIYVKELNFEDCDLRAIDYHTHSQFNDFILKKYPQLETLDYIKIIIWNHNSGINNRNEDKIKYDTLNDWKLIKNYVSKMQYYFFQRDFI